MDHKIRVMLVDDEYLAIEDLKTLIDWESAGFEICSSASSGRQALRIFREKPVDLVITDISMPGMDGISLIEQLKSLITMLPPYDLHTFSNSIMIYHRRLQYS